MQPIDPEEYPPIKGLEGPFQFRSGRVLYYDPREGRYYDRKTDMYLKRDFDPMHESTLSEAATTKKLDRAEYGEMVPLKVGGQPFTFERVASGFHVYVGTYTDDFKGKLPEPITSRPLPAAKAIALAKKQGRVDEKTLHREEQRQTLVEASINKYDIRRAEEAWKDAEAIADSYEEDGDPRERKARAEAEKLKADFEALKAKWEKQKAKSREHSRARSGAMASIGMKRSRYGGWE